MDPAISAFALDIVLGLVKHAIEKVVDYSALGFFEKRKVERHVEDAVASIVEPLLPFLTQEKVSEDKQQHLLQACVDELKPLSLEPEKLLQGSLNGQKIFDNLYIGDHSLPQVVIDDGVKEVYLLLFPAIAELLCKVTAAVKEWQTLAWAENFHRLDDLVSELRKLFNQVDELKHLPEHQADETLKNVRQSLTLKVGLEMDITSLRGDQPLAGNLSEFFVHPEIQEMVTNKEWKPKILNNTAEALAQFVRPNQKAIIFGAPGAGKSTWTKWLQREILGVSNTGFIVRIELRNFAGKELPSMQALVREAAGIHYAEEITPIVISRWLEKQFLMFIFDGFDEIRPDERNNMYASINDLCQAIKGCPVVITSRPLTTDHLERRDLFDTHWTIEPFDIPRIIEYIQHWYQHAPLLAETDREVDASSLANEWQHDPTLAPLTGNPLLLSTLLMVHHLDGRLPSGRSQLYKRYIDGMLGLWDDRRSLVSSAATLTLTQKKQILRGLALHMFLQDIDQLDEAAILAWLQGFLKNAGIHQDTVGVLSVLCERSGLIIGPGIYNFAHKSIAEYLVAEIILDGVQTNQAGQRIDRMYLFEQRDNDRWNSVIFLWAGLASTADLVAFIESCKEIGNWGLAYGLLNDQFDRFSDRETRSRLLLHDLQKANQISEDASRDFGFRNSFSFGYFNLPQFVEENLTFSLQPIRSVVERSNFVGLLVKATQNNTLSISDSLYFQQGNLKRVLSVVLAFNLNDIDNLKTYIQLMQTELNSDETLSIYVMNCFLYNTLMHPKKINSSIDILHELLPKNSGVIPILLISQITYTNPSEGRISTIREAFNILLESGKGKIYPNWLLKTKHWSKSSLIDNVDVNIREEDLFVNFKTRVEKLTKEGVLHRDESYDRTMAYIDTLHEQRASLAAQMGIDLDVEPQPKASEQFFPHIRGKGNSNR